MADKSKLVPDELEDQLFVCKSKNVTSFKSVESDLFAPVDVSILPIKKITEYYAKSEDEALRMKRALLSLIAVVNYRRKSND